MSKNGMDDAQVPIAVWWLTGCFALYTIVMLLFLWKSASNPDDVAVLNTVAAIISAPVGGLIAIAIFISGGRRKEADTDGSPVENRKEQQPSIELHEKPQLGLDSQIVGSDSLARSVDEGVGDKQCRDELHSQSGDRHVHPGP
jgi:hypothetical protein